MFSELTFMTANFSHPTNTLSPITVTFFGTVTLEKDLQDENAHEPMEISEVGRHISTSA